MSRIKCAFLIILLTYHQVSQGCQKTENVISEPSRCANQLGGKCYQSKLRKDHLWTEMEQDHVRYKSDLEGHKVKNTQAQAVILLEGIRVKQTTPTAPTKFTHQVSPHDILLGAGRC